MNSCMRQTPIPDQMHHSFLRDKQAWENAIAMYQGPDPLDHWYNYVCWYENHGHGDPENKFRETLERCLTIFEHSDYYKQDPRLVRLWIKYIDMQAHPLHFYQVLYQRGVGRQVAAFYISWAGYYESIHALKEAESVYSLGFQEKAQSYAELHHAHSKLMYIRQTTPKPPATVAAAVPPQQQQQIPQQQQQPQLQQHQAQQQQQHHQVHFHHPPQQQQPVPSPAQQQQQHVQAAQMQVHASPQQQQQVYQRVAFSQPQQLHMPVQQQQLPAQQQHLYQAHSYQQQQQQQQILHQHQNHQAQQQHVNIEQIVAIAAPGVNYVHQQGVDASQSNNVNVPIEQQLPATATSVQHYEKPLPAAETAKIAPSPQIDGIRLPRKFATYCHNNYETWKPALFLEEPTDPSRHCHYAKDGVYPGTGIEYSPEELRSRKYSVLLAELKQERETNTAQVVMANEAVQLQQLQEIGTMQQLELQQQQQQQLQQIHYYEQQQQHVNVANANNGHEQPKHNNSYAENDGNEDYDEEDGEEEDAEEEEEEDDDDNYPQEALQQQQHHQSSSMVNTIDDLEEQIEASTIRFTMNSATVQQQQGGGSSCSSSANKTIKIKFKKERQHGNNSLKGSNYSAYTIESIYQQEVSSPTAGGGQERRNGHSFHPYSLGQTSTPKASTKRNKKLKNVNKFQIGGGTGGGGSSSNSSSADLGGINNGGTIATNAQRNDNKINNATFNDNANYSFSSAVALDNSNCSLTSAVGRLNFRDVSGVVGGNNTSTNIADFSTYQENSYFATQHDVEAKERRLQKALETIERHMVKEAIDPFSSELCRAFLTKLDFPGTDDAHANYKIIQTPLPKIANTRTLTLPDGVHFNIDKEVGRGSYGSVYKATDANTGAVVALKYQKPPNTWEIYICDQVLKRIQSPNILPGLMDVSTAIIAPNASLIATEFSPFGSLLDINNKIRQATTKVMHESLVMHFSSQICNIINHLHRNKIIHADIKPDNFLLMRIPSTDLHFPSLRLIDFGCAIDMTLFPDVDKTKFRKVIQTDGFTCIEMQEGRPWSYETDLFCIAGTVHVMLLGEYMQLQKRAGSWDIKQKLPRYLKKHVWTKFFSGMLNIKTTSKLPDLGELRCIFEEEAAKMDSELQNQIRTLKNILYRR